MSTYDDDFYKSFRKMQKEGHRSETSMRYDAIAQKNTAKLDTFDADLASATDLLNKVYGGWQSADDMKSAYDTVSSMRNRLNAHKGYTNYTYSNQDLTDYNANIDKYITAYDSALENWGALSSEYGKYKDADSWGVARKNTELYNKYKGLDYEGVKKAREENPDDAEFLSRYGTNVGFSSKEDVKAEIRNVDYLIQNATGAERDSLKYYRNTLYERLNNPNAPFKGSEAFSDGWQPGDLLDALGSTVVDALVKGSKGFLGALEGIGDFATYGVAGLADLVGADAASEYLRDSAKQNMTRNLYLPYEGSNIQQDSFLGGFSDSVFQGVGQMGFNLTTAGMGQGAGLGKVGSEVFSKGALFASATGNATSEAYEGGATDTEALIYGLLSGTVETGSEMMFGGFGRGINSLGLSRGLVTYDDILAKRIGAKISNFVLRNAAEFGIKATGEGFEEIVAGIGNAVAKKLTYMSEEDIWKLIDDEELLNQFLVGTMSSMVTQTPSLMRSYKYGTDYITNRTDLEEAIIDGEFKNRLAEAEKDGNKLSGLAKDKLYRQVEKDLTTKVREQYKRSAPESVTNMANFDTSDSVDISTGNTIKIQGIRSDSGNTVLKTNMGDRTLDSVTLNRRDADLVAMAEGMDDDTANMFVSLYNGGDVNAYRASFDLVRSYGNAAFGAENSVARRGVLTEEQAIKVYEYGISERTSVPQKKLDEITEKHFADGGKILEGTFDDSAVHYEKLNSRQKASISFLKVLSKATGMNVKIFESAVDKDGNREAKQGYYEPSTNTVHVDAYAGMDKDLFDDAIIPVMSHEVTHWMQYKAPDAYAKMSGIIMDTLSREFGVFPEQLVAMEKERLQKNGHGDVTDEYAQDEIIARACEDMLSGNRTVGEIIENMDEQTAKTFSEKFKEVVSKIRAWIKDLLKTYKSNSEEAKILRKYDDKLAELQKAWDEGFAQAIRTNQAVATNKTTGTRYSYSSIANSFFGKEKMSTDDFLSGDYKNTEGYKAYVEQCVNNMRQTRDNFNEAEARAEVEKSIAGIVDVAIAAKKAGYDILDDSEKRNKKDSKNRLLFSSLEPNSDYFTSNDISTICDKRQNFAEIYEDIVRAEEKMGVPEDKRFFNDVDNYFYLHKVMADKGLTQPCRQCYVESMRKNLTPMAKAFLTLVRETNPNNKDNDQLFHQKGKDKGELKSNNATLRERVLEQLDVYGMSVSDIKMETLTTEEGLAQLKIQAPLIYEAFNSFYGQSKPKMPKAATPFRFGELTALLTDNHGNINKRLLNKINHTGGFRLQSYSDFQIQNFVDVLQVIFEAGTLGLNGHAYTKVPAFLDATENTNLKRNVSIFMYKDGGEWKIDRNDSFPYALEDIYKIVNDDKSGNTSIIAVSQNAEMSAWIMANDNVGYGIPFHKSGLKMGVVRNTIVKEGDRKIKGYSGTKDHTKQQTEVWAKANEDHKALTKVKKGIDIYEFWDFENKGNLSKNKLIEKNLKAYINACEKAGYLPKFREYVMNNSKVLNDVLRFAKELGFVSANATVDDISFKYKGYQIPYGYYKFLGDFGMFTPDGKAAPQKILSLKDYSFKNAVDFFKDSETLRRNEILQQFSNGEEREKYRNSKLTTEQLKKVIESKRAKIADEIVSGKRYSTRDSEGNGLTKEQIEFFKESKLRDENGNLKVMYHGTNSASFTVFDASISDDGISLFFTDKLSVASGYSGSYEEYAPKAAPNTASGLNEYLDDKDDFEVIREGGEFKLIRKEDRYVFFSTPSHEEMYEHILAEWADFDVYGARNYKVYLNLKNPFVVDAKGREWNDIPLSKTKGIDRYNYIYVTGSDGTYNVEWEDMLSPYAEAENAEMSLDEIRDKFGAYVADGVESGRKDFESVTVDSKTKELVPRNTRQYAYHAKKTGYDGVIINNVVDMANGTSFFEAESSTVAIAFSPEQVKSVANEKPTTDPDIRYSERVQTITSEDTSLNQTPATFTNFEFESSDRVLDWGGGKYDTAKKAMEATYEGIKIEVVDAFNRTKSHNDRILAEYRKKKANILTINNVLNVINDTDIIEDVIRESKEYLDKDGICYIAIYEGSRDGNSKETSAGWQNNQPAEWYLQFVRKYYKNVVRKGSFIVASDSEIGKRVRKITSETKARLKDNTDSLKKENLNMKDSLYSERQTESIYDAVGELKRLQKENEALKKDIERLKKLNSLERTVTGGILPNDSQIKSVAAFILKNADSKYDKNLLADELREIYSYMQTEDVEWNIAMSKMLDLARSVVEAKTERKVENDYAKFILSTIRGTKVSFNDTQKAEAENAFGKNWNRNYFGWVTVANDGIPLESVWSEWSNQFPDVFSADISDADMATALVDIYDSTKSASEIVEEYDKAEMARDIAFEMYNQLWNVTPLKTLADKHDKEVKRLKFEHRQEMKELREKTDKQVFETRWHYSKLIHEVREARDKKIADIKKESREYTKEYREKLERRSQISQITKKALKLNKWLKTNSKDEHIVEELKKPVGAVLEALDFSSEKLLGTGVPTQRDISLKKAFEHLYKAMQDIEKRQGEEDYSIDMPVDYVEFLEGIKDQVNGIVERVGDNEFVLRDMTLEQLQDVNKMISVLTHIVTSANKALADANRKTISSMAQSTMLYVGDLGKKNSKVGTLSDFFNFDNGLPVYVFKMMGEGGQQIFRNMQNGWDKMAFHVKRIKDYADACYKAKEVKEWSKEVHDFTFDDGSEVKMTTAQIMSLYCLSKRDQARQHLVQGGMRVADFKIGTNKITNEDGALLLPNEIDEVVSKLTARQKEVADALQNFMTTVCSDWGNEVSMRRFGIKAFGEENYFPIQSDSSVLTGDDTPKSDRGSEVFRLLNMDFTKALNPNANNRIVVDNIFDVFATHTSDMAKYNALALPVLDMFRWYNYKESYRINPDNPEDKRKRTKSLKQSLKTAYGEGSTKYIMQFMKDINGAHSGGMSNMERWNRKLISNYKIAAVGANLRVAILQPTSYMRASAVISPKYLTAALAHKPQINKAKTTCGIALWKSLGFYDTNISRGVTDLIKHNDGWYQKTKEISMKLVEWGDAVTWGYLYNACEAEIKDLHPELTGKAKDDAVALRLRDVIYATQVVDSTMTRTQNMRNPNWINQAMTAFMSEPSISYNMLHDLYIQYNADKRQLGSKSAAFKKNGKKIARVTASYFVTLCCASLAGGVIDAARDDDDEKDFIEKLFSNATENAISDMLGMLPGIKDVVSIYKGFNVGRMDMQSIQSTYYATQKLYKAIMKGEWDYKTVYSLIKSCTKAFSQNSGIPLYNAMRDAIAIWNNTVGEMYESLKLK